MNIPIRIVFLGTPAFAVPSLEVLARQPQLAVLGVVTQPDRPAGRGQKLMPSAVKTAALALGLSVFQTESLKRDADLQGWLRVQQPDYLVTVAFGQILSSTVLAIPTLGTVNLHASLLPGLRGPNPIQQAILRGDAETGLTTMLTELGVDTGPTLLQARFAIEPSDTTGTLGGRMAQAGGDLLIETLVQHHDGQLVPVPQDDALATHAPKCAKADAALDWWTQPADILLNRIRAFNPVPGAVTFLQGERIKVLEAVPLPGVSNTGSDYEVFLKKAAPGTIGAIMEEAVAVRCADGWIGLKTVQPAGKRPMPAAAWARNVLHQQFELPPDAEPKPVTRSSV